jgi:hypothetical protein
VLQHGATAVDSIDPDGRDDFRIIRRSVSIYFYDAASKILCVFSSGNCQMSNVTFVCVAQNIKGVIQL